MEVGVRVGVSLSRFFCDERAAALVYVAAPLRRVKHLHEKLRRLFRLQGRFCLVKDGFLLPSSEDLALLSQDDVLSVVPLSADFDFDYEEYDPDDLEATVENVIEKDVKKKKRKKQKDPVEDAENKKNDMILNGKNEKENQSPAVTPERVPKKKHTLFDDPKVTSAIANIEKLHAEMTNPAEQEEIENMKSKALTMLKELAPASTIGVSDGRITKRKRVRIRKSLKNNTSIVNSLSDGESGPPHRTNSLVLINGKVNSHIRFPPAENSTVTVLRNKSCNDDKPRIIHAIEPVKTEIVSEPSVIVPDNDFTEQPAVFDYSIDSILKTLDKFPLINQFPKKDDVILFKMLKMDEQYNPVVSKPMLGKVSSTCPDSSLVRFSILDGHSEQIAPTGKFDLEEEENSSNIEVSDFDIIWSQVIEPRAIR